MYILIKNCNLISMDSTREKIEYNIDILIKDNKIFKIGRNLNIDNDNTKVIDATNNYILPGFINTHSHIPMSIFRESSDGYITQDWLEKKIWPIEDKLTDEDIYNASLLSCIEMIKTGTTTVNDHYFSTSNIINAILKSGMRAEVTRVMMDVDNNLSGRYQELNDLIKNYLNKYETLSINVGIHGLYTASKDCVIKAIELAKKYNLNVHMHFCENSKERIDIENNYNEKNISNIIKTYFNNTHNIFAHCVKLSNEDIKTFKDLNINVSHCPISNLKLGCGIANIPKMLENGINVSLGTDGQGSGCNLDMFETLKFTGLLQKGINENPMLLPAYDILKMATINGAKALNKENLIGSIKENKLADLIILDLSDILLQPINDIFADIVYNAKGSNVITTIINGKIVMENRHLNNLDEATVITKCKNILHNKKH